MVHLAKSEACWRTAKQLDQRIWRIRLDRRPGERSVYYQAYLSQQPDLNWRNPEVRAAMLMLLLTLRGTPTVYQGEELGMQDAPIAPEHIQDPWEKNVPGLGLGRDPVRTPMPWSGESQGGFSTGTPWLPVDMHGTVDQARQRSDGASMLSLYRALLGLRRAEPALAVGSYSRVACSDSVLVYERQHDAGKFQIALNMSDRWQALPPEARSGKLVISTRPDRKDFSGKDRQLAPNEALIQCVT